MKKTSDPIQVLTGRQQTLDREENFVALQRLMLTKPNKREIVPIALVTMFQELLDRDAKLFINNSGINVTINGYNILNVININETTFTLIIKTCHVLFLPKINFDIKGNPLKDKVSKRTKIIVMPPVPPWDKEFATTITNWIFKLPLQYKR